MITLAQIQKFKKKSSLYRLYCRAMRANTSLKTRDSEGAMTTKGLIPRSFLRNSSLSPELALGYNTLYLIIITFIFVWFLFQMVFFAIRTRYNFASDEIHHYGVIHYYLEKTSGSPWVTDQVDSFNFGDLTRNPSFLYHYVMSLFLRIPLLLKYEFVFLRGVGILLSLGTMAVFLKILQLLTKNRFVHVMSLFVLSNTLMFVFMGMAISYDTPMIFLSMLSFYYFIKIWKDYEKGIDNVKVISVKNDLENIRLKHVANMLLIGFTGSIVKYTFFPLFLGEIALLLGIFFVKEKMWLKANFSEFIDGFKIRSSKFMKMRTVHKACFAGLFIIVSILFFERYSINVLKYGNIYPDCKKVISLEQCRQYSPYGRNLYFIENPGPEREIGILPYSGSWLRIMIESIYGIYVHRSLGCSKLIFPVAVEILFLGIVSFALRFKKESSLNKGLLLIFLYYSAVIFAKNFYEQGLFGYVGIAVQGRYFFPIFPMIIYWLNHNLVELFGLVGNLTIVKRLEKWVKDGVLAILVLIRGNKFRSKHLVGGKINAVLVKKLDSLVSVVNWLKFAYVLIASFVLINSGFLFFLKNATSEWYN